MPIQTKSTQAREKRKLIRSSIFFVIPFFECVCFVISFQLCGWISPDGSVSEPHSDKERSKAAWVWFGHSRTAVLGRTTAGGDGGVLGETWEWAVAVIRYWLSPDSHSLAHPQCAANVAFFKLKFDQLIERRWRVCRAESRQNLQREAKYIHWNASTSTSCSACVYPQTWRPWNEKCWLHCVMVTLKCVGVAAAVTSSTRENSWDSPSELTFWNIPPPSRFHPSQCCPGRCLWAGRHRLWQDK